MALKSSTNIRLPDDLKKRLERIAAGSGLKVADLIRMASEQYCDTVEKTGKVSITITGGTVGQVGEKIINHFNGD